MSLLCLEPEDAQPGCSPGCWVPALPAGYLPPDQSRDGSMDLDPRSRSFSVKALYGLARQKPWALGPRDGSCLRCNLRRGERRRPLPAEPNTAAPARPPGSPPARQLVARWKQHPNA